MLGSRYDANLVLANQIVVPEEDERNLFLHSNYYSKRIHLIQQAGLRTNLNIYLLPKSLQLE